ncbi:diguanylate cyclase/phosphodiesterase (GGDEF & EAL domains) with PAS/PAC sensor(s) [Planococcus halocryophilus Or1]|uniref:Diguanylate cyclase n=1 Tax=Planococcus halocryophilus TaxID=1215089 RepID=A0A1C7DSG2_9BACL|nr:EAL domain-containing protein [Planococcus halocryophilus]ANU14405.1 diguanylate cyclase [Planococcus halocryophilus]EMF46106.1 diguanylate cyclase/phosphodiesterase (GGDEF & EAL domains) with PAS/PAC sensor(s) [Planococcus halocryophilus Or1]
MFSITKNRFSIFILFYMAIYYYWMLFSNTSDSVYKAGYQFLSWLAPITAFAILFYVYRKTFDRNRIFWLLLSLGSLSYIIAESISVVSYNMLNITLGYPGVPDFFYFLQIGCYLAAFVYQLKQQQEISYQIKFLFDITIIITVSTALSWHFLIQHLLPGNTASPLLIAVSLGYPIGDLLLLFGVVSLYIGFSHPLPYRVATLIITGLIFQVFADTAHLYSTFANTYSSGNLYNPLWAFSLLLVALAGLHALEPSKRRSSKLALAPTDEHISIRILLPYFILMILFIAMTLEQKEDMTGLIIGAGIAAFLILTRQIFTLGDNRRLLTKYNQLTSVLEHKIEQRTVEVTSSNNQLKETVQQMKHMAYYDVLSGLPNRRLFLEKLEASIVEAKNKSYKLAVVFIDIDRFKNINDTFGHEFGDLLLQAFSQKIVDNLRSIDTLSRQGGDEFTLILNNIKDGKDTAPIIHKLQKALEKPLLIKGQELYISMSIGISVYPKDGETSDELLKNADNAMYSAKEKGRNNYQFFSEDMAFIAARKTALEGDLNRAVINKEFTLHYQPQILAKTGEIIGMEALIRWQKKDGSIVSPGEFIPLAEETRLILPIGEWVLYTACLQAKKWHDDGNSHLKLAVNLSSLQFMDDGLIATIQQVLKKTGFSASSLELEITESVALDDAEKAIARMQTLREIGVQIAIDDFGTGYSSLNYLKRFPLNNLKIAQPFVQDMATNPRDMSLVEAMIFIAHSLDMSVIAEGVETEEQLALLKELGCDEIQGFLFSKPLPADRFTKLLMNGVTSVKVI